MARKSDIPQIKALLALVDKKFGRPAGTPADFVALSDSILHETKEYLSDSTLKRLYNPALGYNTVSERTLNILAGYVGKKHFDDFCDFLSKNGEVESDIVQARGSVNSKDLEPGDSIRFSWLPDRVCTVKYLGDNLFEVTESINASIKPGDTFSCLSFTVGRPLYVLLGGKKERSYGMGLTHGLSSIVKEPAI